MSSRGSTASVFARQAAAKNVPKAGAAARSNSVVKAPAPSNARKNSGAPPASAKAKSMGKPVTAGAKAANGGGKGPPQTADDDEENEGGGVVTCANRDLLRQMLQGAVTADDSDREVGRGDSDDERGAFQLHARVAPGTPQVGDQRRTDSVPTLTAAACSSPTRIAAPPPRGQGSSMLRLAASHGSIKAMAGVAHQFEPLPARPGSPQVIAASMQRAIAAPSTRMAPPAAGAVVTGPPQRGLAGVQHDTRPGSRGGAGPASVEVIQQRPSSRGGVQSPSSGAGRAMTIGTRVGSGYANIHSAKAGGTAPVGNAKAAARPRCGPQAFDMLRNMVGTSQGATVVQGGGSPTASTAVDSAGAADARGDDEEEDGFVMPADSEPGSDDEGGIMQPAQVAKPPGGGVPIASSGLEKESAADYVERVKRGLMGGNDTSSASSPQIMQSVAAPVQGAAAAAPAPTQAPAAARALPKQRPRSSDAAKPVPSGGALRSQPTSGSGVRSRSSDPRAAVEAARKSPPWPGDSDDESDDDEIVPINGARPAGAPGGGPIGAWKADVRSLVKDFAREERARGVDRAGVPSKARPPKAPSVAAAEGAAPGRADDVKRGEELVYSRKPRDVDFTPATVEDYKQKYSEKVKLGSLGPDLDDESLLMKKAVQEKVKQFSKELHRINKQRTVNAGPKPEPKPESKPAGARAKALEFAKQSVPKPKVAPKPSPAPAAPQEIPSHEEADEWDRIREMERRHHEDRARVSLIKEYMAGIGVR